MDKVNSKVKSTKNLGGQPPYYKTPEELQSKIDLYFKNGYRKKKIVVAGVEITVPAITITDLVLFLGFCDRQSFYDYEKREGFSCTIKKARSFIEREYEELLRHGNCTGAIFALKNFGWKDESSINHAGEVNIHVHKAS
jgi:hypothetical protein